MKIQGIPVLTFRAGVAFLDVQRKTIAYVTPYVCKQCSNTHINIDIEHNMVLSLDLTQDQAIVLAKRILEPFVLDER